MVATHKICSLCKELKPVSIFNKASNSKDGLDGRCRPCYLEYRRKNYIKTQSARKSYAIKRRLKFPWEPFYYGARIRCNNPKDIHYPKYGAKGIKFLMSMDEVRQIWLRDKAWDMKRPSIDRINNKGHYEISNCRFIELSENSRKGNTVGMDRERFIRDKNRKFSNRKAAFDKAVKEKIG